MFGTQLDKHKPNKMDTKMKTLKSTIAIVAATALIFTGSVFAMDFNFEEEAYINDIPFNTEEIVNMVSLESPTYDFEEETYINDIPFNTACITADCKYEVAIAENYQFEEESIVEDIPFDTRTVLTEKNYNQATNVTYNFEEEVYVDDIPFDTYAVVTTHNCNHYAYKH